MTTEWETREKQAFGEAVIWVVALCAVWMRLTDGSEVLGQSIGLIVVEQNAMRVFSTWVTIGILAGLAQLGLRTYLASRGNRVDFRDERDQLIEKQADRAAYWTGIVVANLIIGHVLMGQAFGHGRAIPLDLVSPTGITLGLLTLLVLQELARQLTVLSLYRRT